MDRAFMLPQGTIYAVYYNERIPICSTDDITQDMLKDFNKQYGKRGRKSIKYYEFDRGNGHISKIYPNSYIGADLIITVRKVKANRCR